MGFVRQKINNQSTFTTGTDVLSVTNPTFTVWDNTTTASTFEWELAKGWKLVIDADTEKLRYEYKGNSILELNSSGYTLGSLATTNLGSLPDASTYETGALIRVNNELYVNVA